MPSEINEPNVTVAGLTLLFALLGAACGGDLEVRVKPEVADTIVQDGDLVLRGDEVFEISDARFVLRGNLVLRDQATFRATNVLWDVPQEFNKQFGIRVQDDATFELENVFIDSGGPWLRIDFLGNSSVRLSNVWSPDPNIPWYTVEGGPRVLIEDSVVGITPFRNATPQVAIKRSNTWIEILVPGDGELDVSLPSGLVQAWSLPPASVTGIPYTIEAEDTTFRLWSIGLSPGSRVTVRDTERINLLFSVGSTWSGAEVELRGLRPGFVEDRTWEADGAVLRVINTGINEWYPNAGGNGKLTLVDSQVNEMEPWGEAEVTLRNSQVSVIHANDKSEVWVYDSSVEYDVVAFDQATIHLFNTEVGGTVTEAGSGRVFVDVRDTSAEVAATPSVGSSQ